MQIETTAINETCLKNIIKFMGIEAETIHFIKYSQNFIYEINGHNNTNILRITSDMHRTRSQIAAELQWIDLLKAEGVNACAAIRKDGGDAIYSFEVPADTLHCVLFEKAKGRPVNSEMLNDELYYLHGALTGKIHHITRNCPVEITRNRFDWQNNRLFTSDIQKYIPDNAKEKIALTSQMLISEAMKIPKNKESYGVIHFDLHYDNFFLHGKDLHLFDFDNCSNGYFVNDIAKAIWASVFTYHRKLQFEGKSPFVNCSVTGTIMESVWEPFWRGYRSENEIDESWVEQIPLFFELIHLKEFVHHYRCGVPYRNDELKQIFAVEQQQIEERCIPVNFDFVTGKSKKEF